MARPATKPPLLIRDWTPALPGAVLPWPKVLGERDDSPQSHRVPIPFDSVNIIAAPASGTTTTLVGAGAAVALGPLPYAYRGIVDGIFPYLEAAAGPVGGPRVPVFGGSSIIWRLLVNGRPKEPYHNITTILAPWNGFHTRPLLDLLQADVLSAEVSFTDPVAVFTFVGIRITGRWIPWDRETR